MPQRVVDQAFAEGHHAVREVVLREPGHHALLLHVGTAGHVHDQVAQVLPVPGGGGKRSGERHRRRVRPPPAPELSPHHVHGPGPHLRVAAHDGHAGGEGAVDAEDDELRPPGHHGQIAVCRCVVAPGSRRENRQFTLISWDLITALIWN